MDDAWQAALMTARRRLAQRIAERQEREATMIAYVVAMAVILTGVVVLFALYFRDM